jgi:hypothetical protein
MGLLKYLCSKFSCKSSCKFNNELFDSSHLAMSLDNYDLKMKDVKRILRILNKRALTNVNTGSIII